MGRAKIIWSKEFAYALGLLATDGNLSPDGRHINFTSKDFVLVQIFKECLGLKNKIGLKSRGGEKTKKYFQIQFGDRNFYEYMEKLGITAKKSKTIGELKVEDKYFADFLRGCIDGDGSIGAYRHPESKNPQLRVRMYSASSKFLEWLKKRISELFKIESGWIEAKEDGMGVLVYAKADSIILLDKIYYKGVEYKLKREYNTAKPFLRA